jgi:hypothetical protein
VVVSAIISLDGNLGGSRYPRNSRYFQDCLCSEIAIIDIPMLKEFAVEPRFPRIPRSGSGSGSYFDIKNVAAHEGEDFGGVRLERPRPHW